MILKNRSPIRIEGKNPYTHIITIKKNNLREILPGTIIKTIILQDLEFPINNPARQSGNSLIVTIPTYQIKNKLLDIGTMIDTITV